MVRWILIAVTAACVAALLYGPKMVHKPIKIALDRHWATLHPGLQHTRNGDLVLSNQFDALVGINSIGAPVPLGAKSWEVLDSFRTYRFRIDREKRFSDGSALSAHDYKRSWEEALRLSPRSANSSLADVVNFVEGFDQFDKLGELTGVKVIDDETLEVNFTKPLRLALDFLSGNRFAAYKRGSKDGEYLGTGKYVITQVSENELDLNPNPYAGETPAPVKLVYIPTQKSREDLIAGSVDAIGYSAGDEILLGRSLPPTITPVIGQDAMHAVLAPNGLPGRTFSNKKFRQALQWFALKKIVPSSADLNAAERAGFFHADAQVYLPFQAGRLSDSEVEEFLAKGEQSFAELIAHTKKHPLRVWVTDATEWLLPALKAGGLVLTEDSQAVEPKNRIEAYYKTHQPDILVVNVSVTNSDPDGIYHLLGRHGAISSPMVQRALVMDLMEKGRTITDINAIDPHYSKVSRAVLDEVPIVHLGFSKTVSLLQKDRVSIIQGVQLRNQGHLHIFKGK